MGIFDGPLVRTALGAQPGGAIRQPNGAPLGARTGAPVRTVIKTINIAPGTAPTQVVDGTRENRIIILTAPFVGFTIFVGDSGVDTTKGYGLVSAIGHEFVLPGFQEMWAVSDSPTFLMLRVQIAPILIGDTERE